MRGKTEVCLGPGCHPPVVRAYGLLFVSHHLISAQASWARHTKLHSVKTNSPALGLLQESCEMQLKELRKIQIGRHLRRSLFQQSAPSMTDHKATSGYLQRWRSHHLSGPHPRTAPCLCDDLISVFSKIFLD